MRLPVFPNTYVHIFQCSMNIVSRVCQRRHPTTEFNDKVFMLIGQWAFIQRSACSSTHQMIQIHFGSPIMGYSNRQRFNVVSSRIRRIRGDGRS